MCLQILTNFEKQIDTAKNLETTKHQGFEEVITYSLSISNNIDSSE